MEISTKQVHRCLAVVPLPGSDYHPLYGTQTSVTVGTVGLAEEEEEEEESMM